MNGIFTLLILISFLCLFVGLITPGIFSWLFKEALPSRKKILLVFTSAAIVFLVLLGVTNDPAETELALKQQAATTEAAKIAKAAEEAKKQEERAKAKIGLRVKFDVEMSPAIAATGTEIIISADVENLDDRTIDNVKITLHNIKFVEEGLKIIEAPGATRNGRDFIWKDEIKPGETRSFYIVAQAYLPGKYESIIELKAHPWGDFRRPVSELVNLKVLY